MNAREVFLVLCLTDITEAERRDVRLICHAKSLKLTSTAGRVFVDLFISRKAAEDEAGRLASLEPTKLFTVLGSLSYYETTTPSIIEKTFNDRGEFVLKEPK